MYPSRKPFAFDLKKRLLSYLRGTKQIEETTTVSSIQKIKKNSWELSDKEKSSIKEHQEFSNINKNSKKLYEESIILISSLFDKFSTPYFLNLSLGLSNSGIFLISKLFIVNY